jgi:hypothetical protein
MPEGLAGRRLWRDRRLHRCRRARDLALLRPEALPAQPLEGRLGELDPRRVIGPRLVLGGGRSWLVLSHANANSLRWLSENGLCGNPNGETRPRRYSTFGVQAPSESSASNVRRAHPSQNGYRSRTPLDQPAHLTACASSSASRRPHTAQRTVSGTSAMESPPRRNVPTAGNSLRVSRLELKVTGEVEADLNQRRAARAGGTRRPLLACL